MDLDIGSDTLKSKARQILQKPKLNEEETPSCLQHLSASGEPCGHHWNAASYGEELSRSWLGPNYVNTWSFSLPQSSCSCSCDCMERFKCPKWFVQSYAGGWLQSSELNQVKIRSRGPSFLSCGDPKVMSLCDTAINPVRCLAPAASLTAAVGDT